MSDGPPAAASVRAGLGAAWRARPRAHGRTLWALTLGLDALPWPWGEDLLAGLYAATSIVRRSRMRTALAWAAAHRTTGRWRLALALCAFRGRWVARWAIVGLRDPRVLRDHVEVRGTEHLDAAGGAAILLGFHLGPPSPVVALRVAGHRVGWVGGERISRRWLSPAWHSVRDPRLDLWLETSRPSRAVSALYAARRLLLDGTSVFMMADGHAGHEAFSLSISGTQLFVNKLWLALRRQTGARVLPVLTHLEGRTQVVTIHPALPDGDDTGDWRELLQDLVGDYVRRFPGQCPRLAFRTPREMALRAASEGRGQAIDSR